MQKRKKIIKYIIINIVILIIIYLFFLQNIKICFIHNIFKIPCPGCGLTRAMVNFIRGDIVGAVNYHLLAIPLLLGYISCSIWYIIDIVTNKDTMDKWFKKNKNLIIVISVIVFIISYARSLTNPLLY